MLGAGGHSQLLTAQVEGVARAVSETIQAGDLLEARDHAEGLHPRQERRIGERSLGKISHPQGVA